MKDNFNIGELLTSAVAYKGLPFPGGWLAKDSYTRREQSQLGATLRKKDASGRWYFMPVQLIHQGKHYEIPNAMISFTGKKTIVETPMVGRKGTVKELINLQDYEISLQAVYEGEDFPDEELAELNTLYNLNESVEIDCALTSIFLDQDDRVVIKSIDVSDVKGTENMQLVKMNLVTDCYFELVIE